MWKRATLGPKPSVVANGQIPRQVLVQPVRLKRRRPRTQVSANAHARGLHAQAHAQTCEFCHTPGHSHRHVCFLTRQHIRTGIHVLSPASAFKKIYWQEDTFVTVITGSFSVCTLENSSSLSSSSMSARARVCRCNLRLPAGVTFDGCVCGGAMWGMPHRTAKAGSLSMRCQTQSGSTTAASSPSNRPAATSSPRHSPGSCTRHTYKLASLLQA